VRNEQLARELFQCVFGRASVGPYHPGFAPAKRM